MGVWGTGINSNDTACDVVDTCKEIYPILPPEEANQKVLEEYRSILSYDEDDDEVADFWYALVNWQWSHGVLPEENKRIALELLDKRRGMSLWEEASNKSDIRKRSEVLEALRSKLISPQPPVKIPKAKINRPKHKIGDIIIFQTGDWERDVEVSPWFLNKLYEYDELRDKIYHRERKLKPIFDAHNKYLAFLCVDIEREPYSKYFPDLFHENSIYALYDYCDSEKPTVARLSECGFLPTIDVTYSDFNRGIVSDIDWIYTFVTVDSFRLEKSHISSLEKHNVKEESERFHRLIAEKGYRSRLEQCLGSFTLSGVFNRFYAIKLRVSNNNVFVDNLVDKNGTNPELLSPCEYNKNILKNK